MRACDLSLYEGVATIMRKRRLGKTGLKVSVIGFGGIPIIALSRKEAERVVRYAYDRGINACMHVCSFL